jgi:cytochrome bd-type quinol oxidase subunit 2
MSSVILFWLVLFVASVSLSVLLAKRTGSGFPLSALLVLSILSLAGLGTLVYLLTASTESGVSIQQHEAKVYVFAEIAFGLIILLVLLLPPTLLLWLMRLRTKLRARR